MSQTQTPAAEKERQPYVPPAVREEQVFEREALQGACNEPCVLACDPDCDAPSKTPS